MHSFRSTIQLSPSKWHLPYTDSYLFLGSCFAEHMSKAMVRAGFTCLSNPAGIIYNPVSLVRHLKQLLAVEDWQDDRIVEREGFVFHYDMHSVMGKSDPLAFRKHWDRIQQDFQAFWAKAPNVFLSLGTAWVYRYEGDVVANCHKQGKENFQKELLSLAEIVEALKACVDLCREQGKKLVFTVSPVRHLKDGMVENMRSKALLLTAIHEVIAEAESYFPSFEIMMDDLRDYRFYTEDMLHPSRPAIAYIWEQFQAYYFSKETRAIIREVEQYRKMEDHRPLRKDSEETKKFLAAREQRGQRLMEEYPFLDL